MKLLYEESGELVEFPIDEGELVIGRKSYCDLCFPDTSVSKKHARIVRKGDDVELQDAGSRNGTVLNGDIIAGTTPLRAGDVVQIGKIKLQVEEDKGGGGRSRSRSSAVRFDSSSVADDSDDEDTSPDDSGRHGSSKGTRAADARKKSFTFDESDDFDAADASDPDASGSTSVEDERPKARLVSVAGVSEIGKIHELGEGTITLGAKDGNDVVLDADGVSRFHAEIRHGDGKWHVKDLGSRNGVYVNGTKADGEQALKNGQEVQIGAARLRFEVPGKPAPDLSALLKDDRVRKGLAVGIIGLCVLALFAPIGGGGGIGGGDNSWNGRLVQGLGHLKANELETARAIFDDVKLDAAGQPEGDIARAFYEVNELWERRGKKFSFKWEEATKLLDGAAGLPGLPPEMGEWIKTEGVVIARDARAKKVFLAADETVNQAKKRESRNPDIARLGYIEALNRFENEVPKESVFWEDSSKKAEGLRVAIMKSFEDSIQRLYSEDTPPWPDIRDLIHTAIEFAQGKDKRRLLEELSSQVVEEITAESLYNDAYDIIELRQVDRYSEAKTFLRRIPSDTRLFEQAQALVQWIEAELLSIEAFSAYDNGDALKAISLIDEILNVSILAPDVREFVAKKKNDIGFVYQRFEQGLQAFQAQDHYQAMGAFNDVLRTERRPENKYHQRANKYMATSREAIMTEVRGHLKRGNDFIASDNWADSYKEYVAAIKASNGDQEVWALVRRQVDARAAGELAKVKQIIFKRQKLLYDEARVVCKAIVDLGTQGSDAHRAAQENLVTLNKR